MELFRRVYFPNSASSYSNSLTWWLLVSNPWLTLEFEFKQIFFVFPNWKRVQHITEPSPWFIHSLQLLLQGATMFTKILLGQMQKWEKKLVKMETKKSSLKVDPYACAIKVKNRFFDSLITVGHIPREISWHLHFFIKIEGGKVIGHVKSLTYKLSSIPSGGLEIPLQLTFTCDDKLTLNLMNRFVKSL